jgi:LPS-assembly lipoprotein
MRAAAILAGLAIAGAAALSGCGFTPLYDQPGLVGGMTHVEVVAPKGRVGYLLGQDLNDDLGHTPGTAPIYRLDMELTQTRAAHGLTENATAQRYELDLAVAYRLTEIASGTVAHTGRVVSVVSYDSADQPYAGIAAREDTENRLAQDAAAKIQLDLAAWLARRPSA